MSYENYNEYHKNNIEYRNFGNHNSGNWNSGDRNSGNRNSGNANSGYWNSGDRNSGNWNSGNWNSGNWNSGIFNTNEPKMRSFNKECEFTYTEFRSKFGYKDIELPICSWINIGEMTEDEKKSINGCVEMGGYLKTLSYKEAWAVAWKNASQEQKDWYKSLPNFDATIFEQITGIKINIKREELLKKADELILKAEELKKQAENY